MARAAVVMALLGVRWCVVFGEGVYEVQGEAFAYFSFVWPPGRRLLLRRRIGRFRRPQNTMSACLCVKVFMKRAYLV